MNDLMTMISTLPPDTLGLIQQIAPELATLSEEQRNHIFKRAAYNKLTGKAEKILSVATIDWQMEREEFLNTYQSVHSKRTYRIGLSKFEHWACRENINPAAAGYADIDNFIVSLKAEGSASVTIRRDCAAVSAFFTFLERRHEGIKNSFRGTKQRPKNEPKKPPKVPTESEVSIIIDNANPRLAAALSIMAYRGLRCGALAGLSAWGGQFETVSKGKTIRGVLPKRVVTAIEAAGLSLKKPFDGLNTNSFEKEVEYHVKRLYKTGKLSRCDSKGNHVIFNCHSFRHFFSVSEYAKDKDIHRLKALLFHGDINVTDRYLRSLREAV